MFNRGRWILMLLGFVFIAFVSIYAEFDVLENEQIDLMVDIKKLTYIPELKIGSEITDQATYDTGDSFEALFSIDIDESNMGLLCVKLESEIERFKVRLYYSPSFELAKKSIKVFKTTTNQGYLGERLLQKVTIGRYYLRVSELKKSKNQKSSHIFKLALEIDRYEPNGYKEQMYNWWFLEDWEIIKKSSLINSKGDVDWYRIDLGHRRSSNTFKIYIPGPDNRNEDNLEFRVFSESGESLAVWNDYSSWLELSVPKGTYYVRVARSDMSFSRAIFRKYDIFFSLGNLAYIKNGKYSNNTNTVFENRNIPNVSLERDILSNVPNPFNPETDIAYEVVGNGNVVLSVFNTKGKKVIELVNGNKDSGSHSVHWNGKDSRGKDMPSGVYYAVLEVNGKRYTKKMIMLK